MHLIGIVAIIYVIYKLIQEKISQHSTKYTGMIFDWRTYDDDVRRGLNPKRNLDKYYIDPNSPRAIVDVERYEYDKKIYTKETVERNKMSGEYLHKAPIIDYLTGRAIKKDPSSKE